MGFQYYSFIYVNMVFDLKASDLCGSRAHSPTGGIVGGIRPVPLADWPSSLLSIQTDSSAFLP